MASTVSVPLTADANSAFQGASARLVTGAHIAFQSGLPRLAQALYLDALTFPALPEDERHTLSLQLASAYIQTQDFDAAWDILDNQSLQDSAWYLRYAWLLQAKNPNDPAFEAACNAIDPKILSEADLPWYYILQGLRQYRQGNLETAETFCTQAIALSVSEAQTAQFELLVFKHKLLFGTINNEVLSQLEQRYKRASGRKQRNALARQYAIALDTLGQTDAALQVLNEQITLLPSTETKERPLNQLLIGVLVGPDSIQGRQALQWVLTSKAPQSVQSMALQLLAKSHVQGADPQSFEAFLKGLIEESQVQPLLDTLYLLHTQVLLTQGKWDLAERSVQALLERFPGSPYKQTAFGLMAYSACHRSPPQYRSAADHLAKLRDITQSPGERLLLTIVIADCYYANGDYLTAASLYASSLEDLSMPMRRGIVATQLVQSYLKVGDYARALEVLDHDSYWPPADELSRWRAEWNYAQALFTSEDVVLGRIARVLSSDLPMSLELRLRFMWLKCHALLFNHQSNLALDACNELLDMPMYELPVESRQLIISQTLLLKARAQFELNDASSALATFQILHTHYSGSEAAIVANLEEARYYAQTNQLVSALQSCLDILDTAPQSVYAPISLYEAATYSQLRGQPTALEQGLSLLERLISEYPQHSLVFYARIKQAEICSSLGRFEVAHLILSQALQLHAKHPDASRAELALAKALLALSLQDSTFVTQAANQLERLSSLSALPVDLRVEAAYHYAFLVAKNPKLMDPNAAYWLVITQFLEDTPLFESLTTQGHYWLSRATFDLAHRFESAGHMDHAAALYSKIISHQLPGADLAQSRIQEITP